MLTPSISLSPNRATRIQSAIKDNIENESNLNAKKLAKKFALANNDIESMCEFIASCVEGQLTNTKGAIEKIIDTAFDLKNNFVNQVSPLDIKDEEFATKLERIIKTYADSFSTIDAPLCFVFRPFEKDVVLRFHGDQHIDDITLLDVSKLDSAILISLPHYWVEPFGLTSIGKTVHALQVKKYDQIAIQIVLANNYIQFVKDAKRIHFNGMGVEEIEKKIEGTTAYYEKYNKVKPEDEQEIAPAARTRPPFIKNLLPFIDAVPATDPAKTIDPKQIARLEGYQCLNVYSVMLDGISAMRGGVFTQQQKDTFCKLCSQHAIPNQGIMMNDIFTVRRAQNSHNNFKASFLLNGKMTLSVICKAVLDNHVTEEKEIGTVRWETYFTIAKDGSIEQVSCLPSAITTPIPYTGKALIYLEALNTFKRELEKAFEYCSSAQIEDKELSVEEYLQIRASTTINPIIFSKGNTAAMFNNTTELTYSLSPSWALDLT